MSDKPIKKYYIDKYGFIGGTQPDGPDYWCKASDVSELEKRRDALLLDIKNLHANEAEYIGKVTTQGLRIGDLEAKIEELKKALTESLLFTDQIMTSWEKGNQKIESAIASLENKVNEKFGKSKLTNL